MKLKMKVTEVGVKSLFRSVEEDIRRIETEQNKERFKRLYRKREVRKK